MNLLIRVALGVALAMPLTAQASTAPACVDAPYRAYDFFVGNWNVYHADGKLFAHDVVTKDVGGCAILEHWNGGDDKGVGYSGYDAQRKRWIQDFFENDGTVLTFVGHPVAQGMLFEGTDLPKPGVERQHRVLFRKRPDGVEEFWTVSTDGGRTWKTVFDGFFRRSH